MRNPRRSRYVNQLSKYREENLNRKIQTSFKPPKLTERKKKIDRARANAPNFLDILFGGGK